MQPTEDERVLAALSHASIVANIFNLAGMIATALIWTMQRERSRYVRAHALQSLVYQGMVLMISAAASGVNSPINTNRPPPASLKAAIHPNSPG